MSKFTRKLNLSVPYVEIIVLLIVISGQGLLISNCLADEIDTGVKNMLKAIGYMEGYTEAPDKIGVTTYDKEKACAGLNLYSTLETAVLMDMEGNVLHRWSHSFNKIFPDYPQAGRHKTDTWRRVHLMEDGSLLLIYGGTAMVKLDAESQVIWKNPAWFHHDLMVLESGFILSLTREAKVVPRINPDRRILEDFVVLTNPQGKIIKKISIVEAFERSRYAPVLKRMRNFGDIFHTNTVEMFDGSLAHLSPYFKKGNIMVSMRAIDYIAIIDAASEKVVWALTGQWHRQHQPTLLNNGNILLFDNCSREDDSQILELDPFSQKIKWGYNLSGKRDFYTSSCGSSSRLPNGNTLITESNKGRAFEVTPEKKIVWEFFNPARAGDSDKIIATLFEMIRLPEDFPLGWTQ